HFLQYLCEALYWPHFFVSHCIFFVLFLSLNLGMSLLQDSILWGTSCRHRDGKGAGVSTPKAPVRTHWASSPKSCSSTGAFLSFSYNSRRSQSNAISFSQSSRLRPWLSTAWTCGLGICRHVSGRGHSLTMWPAWPHRKQVCTTLGARAQSTTMASPALVGHSMEGGAGVRASGWAREGRGAGAGAWGSAAGVKRVWGKGGRLVVGRTGRTEFCCATTPSKRRCWASSLSASAFHCT